MNDGVWCVMDEEWGNVINWITLLNWMRWMREKGGRDWFWGLRREMIVLRERLSVLFMKWEWVDMDGCCWGDVLMMIYMIDIDELSVCLCFHPQWERERERERFIFRLIEELLKWLSIGIEKWVSDFKLFSKPQILFFLLFLFLSLFLTSTPLHPPTSSFHTEPSISLSCCPSWWLWEWLCWWWLLFVEMTHKHFVTLFQVFVHWTRLGSLPHVVGVMTMVLPSLLKTVQPGHVLFIIWDQRQGLFWLHCLWFVSFLFCSFFLMIVIVFLHFSFSGVFNPEDFLF